MRKWLLGCLLLVCVVPAKAELPGYALQILCKGDVDTCQMVVGEIANALMRGAHEGALSTSDEIARHVMSEKPPGEREAFRDLLVKQGYYTAIDAVEPDCAQVIYPGNLVELILEQDNALVKQSGITAADLVLSLLRGINRESCNKLVS